MQGTIFPVISEEFRGILAAIAHDSDEERTKLQRWLHNARVEGGPLETKQGKKRLPQQSAT